MYTGADRESFRNGHGDVGVGGKGLCGGGNNDGGKPDEESGEYLGGHGARLLTQTGPFGSPLPRIPSESWAPV